MLNEQPCPCATVTVRPATLMVPVRDGPVAAAAVKVMVPAPSPLTPEVMVIHGALLVAVHEQPAAAVTPTDRFPPLASTLRSSGETSKVQPGDSVTVTTWPAIVSVPLRAGPVVGATVKPTVPFPAPAAVVTEIQSTS